MPTLIPAQTLSGVLIPPHLQSGIAGRLATQILLILGASLLIAASAQLAIRLPISYVPITGQTFAVLIVGLVLGARLGALAVIAYLLEGLYWPVFAEGRTWGDTLTLWGAGYLFGFIAAAYITGWLAERGWDRRPLSTAAAMALGNLAIYIPGMLWLWLMYLAQTDLGAIGLIRSVLGKGFAVFLLGDVLKIALAMVVFPTAWRLVGRHR